MDYTSSNAFTVLSHLTRLQRLTFRNNNWLPASLSSLTWLRSLTLHPFAWTREPQGWQHSSELQLNGILLALGQLTHLGIQCTPTGIEALPAAMARLSQLQSFAWDGALPADPQLPWLPRLHQLAVPYGMLACSPDTLEAATRLERLDVLGPSLGRTAWFWGEPGQDPDPSCWDIIRRAATHPTLSHLRLVADLDTESSQFPRAMVVAEAQLLNPALHISLSRYRPYPPWWTGN